MYKAILSKLTFDIGIDLGTANTLVALKDKGTVIREPSVVAINKDTEEVLAVGEEAKHMIGRTPSNIVSTFPLSNGVINDFDSTEAMMRYFINKVHNDYYRLGLIRRPRLVVGIPSKITEVEMKAVIDAGKMAGAREVYLIEEPVAAAVGSMLPIESVLGTMIVDIGGGTTDIAIISMGGIVVDRSLRIAGNDLDEAIRAYARNKYNLQIGLKMAESLKIGLGSATSVSKVEEQEVTGRDLVSGLPTRIKMTNAEVYEAMYPILERILDAAKDAIDETPPEILADLLDKGIYLTGGGGLIRNISKLFEEKLKIPTIVVEDPLNAVVKGTERLLDEIELLHKVKMNSEGIL